MASAVEPVATAGAVELLVKLLTGPFGQGQIDAVRELRDLSKITDNVLWSKQSRRRLFTNAGYKPWQGMLIMDLHKDMSL